MGQAVVERLGLRAWPAGGTIKDPEVRRGPDGHAGGGNCRGVIGFGQKKDLKALGGVIQVPEVLDQR